MPSRDRQSSESLQLPSSSGPNALPCPPTASAFEVSVSVSTHTMLVPLSSTGSVPSDVSHSSLPSRPDLDLNSLQASARENKQSEVGAEKNIPSRLAMSQDQTQKSINTALEGTNSALQSFERLKQQVKDTHEEFDQKSVMVEVQLD